MKFITISFLILGFVVPCKGDTRSSESWESIKTTASMYNVRQAFHVFWREYSEFPKGDIPTMLKVLTGQNPKKIIFIEFRKPKTFLGFETRHGDLDAQGYLLDGWGNRFIFNVKESKEEVVLKSLGKNGKDDQNSGDDREITIIPPEPNKTPQ
jgi:hypothetical protein